MFVKQLLRVHTSHVIMNLVNKYKYTGSGIVFSYLQCTDCFANGGLCRQQGVVDKF